MEYFSASINKCKTIRTTALSLTRLIFLRRNIPASAITFRWMIILVTVIHLKTAFPIKTYLSSCRYPHGNTLE